MNIKDGTSVTRSKCNSNNRNRNCHILIEQRLYPCCLIVAANYFEFENRSVPHGCNLCPTHLFFGAHACRCILKEMTCIFIVVQSVGDYFATCYIQIGVGPVVCYVLHTWYCIPPPGFHLCGIFGLIRLVPSEGEYAHQGCFRSPQAPTTRRCQVQITYPGTMLSVVPHEVQYSFV